MQNSSLRPFIQIILFIHIAKELSNLILKHLTYLIQNNPVMQTVLNTGVTIPVLL